MSFLKIFQIFGLVSAWFMKAAEDGKIDTDEVVELVEGIVKISGLDITINVK